MDDARASTKMIGRVGTVLLISASLAQAACVSSEEPPAPVPQPAPVPRDYPAPMSEPSLPPGPEDDREHVLREIPEAEHPEAEHEAGATSICLKTDTKLPAFPWPPPRPSAMVKLPRAILLEGLEANERTLGAVSARLESALGEAGYPEYSFHAIGCDGFALITGLERTDERGRPLDGARRWAPPGPDSPWSLREYVARLFYAKPGYYRQIIFAGTDEPYEPQGLAEAPTRQELRSWVKSGRTWLPYGDHVPFGPDHELHALVYEFKKSAADEEVEQVSPSLIGGNEHLAAIYAALARQE